MRVGSGSNLQRNEKRIDKIVKMTNIKIETMDANFNRATKYAGHKEEVEMALIY